MSLAESFDNRMEALGGKFYWEHAPENVRSAYKEVSDRANDLVSSAKRVIPNLPEVYVDFILRPEINAVATRDNRCYFIGITTGTLFMLRTIIGRMLSDSNVFTFVGDPGEESSDLKHILKYSADAEEMLKQISPITPVNEIRRIYAGFLQDQALMFLVGHELTHIAHGHVDYLKSVSQFEYTNELEWFGRKSNQAEISRQAMEMDADQRSIRSRIDSLRITSSTWINDGPPWMVQGFDPADLIRDWAISLNILFRLFGDIRFSKIEETRSNHPPVPLRRLLCEMETFQSVKEFWDPALASSVMQKLDDARRETELAFSSILCEPFSQEYAPENIAVTGYKYAERLLNVWNSEVVEKLRPFSYEW